MCTVGVNCVSAHLPRCRFHHQVGHPCRWALAHRPLVVQDEHLVLTDLRHKVQVLLQTHRTHTLTQTHTGSRTSPNEILRICIYLCQTAGRWRSEEATLPEPCRCDRSGQLTWLRSRKVQRELLFWFFSRKVKQYFKVMTNK